MADVVNQKELKKLLKTMEKFSNRVQNNVVVGSTRAAANVVRDEMRDKVSKETKTLQKAIATKKKKSKKNVILFKAYIRRVVISNGEFGKKNTKQYGYYLEYGTKYQAAKPFIRPSLTSVGTRPLQAARSYFKPRIAKEIKKAGFKNG